MTAPAPGSRGPVCCSAILVAAGSSSRMAAGAEPTDRKPWLDLAGWPLLAWSIRAFEQIPDVAEIVLVVHPDDLERARHLRADDRFARIAEVVEGGASRTESVRRGVEASSPQCNVLAIHDAARPLLDAAEAAAAIQAADEHGAALLGHPLRDTPKQISSDSGEPFAVRTLDRSEMWVAQTPQCFGAARFRSLLLEHAEDDTTDDAALWERHVGPVRLIEGSSLNFKVTTPDDLELARALLERRIDGSGNR